MSDARPGPDELAALRDGLARLLARPAGGWLARRLGANPLADPDAVRLLERCRDAFDALLRPPPEPPPAEEPSPSWLAALDRAAADAPAALRERLRGLRSPDLGDAAAVELHVEFWDTFRGEWGGDRATAFADALTAALGTEFGLTPFYPTNYQDHPPGWVQATAGCRMTTGRVREVLRPGLTNTAGGLRVPARVAVE